MRRPLLCALAVSALIVTAAACGSGDDTVGTGASSSSASTASSATTAAPTTAGGGTASSASTTAPGLRGATVDDKSGPRTGEGVAFLDAVRVGGHGGFDRVVFQFAGQASPAWTVGYAEGPFTEDASGEPVAVEGGAFLQVSMKGASGFDIDTGKATYTGPRRVPATGTANVTEVVSTGDFEGVVGWVIGLDGQAPFTVTALTSPSRLVVDIAAQP